MILVVAALGCESSGGAAPATGGSGSAVAQVPPKNPGGGFSADLAKKLDPNGSTTAGKPTEAKVEGAPTSDSTKTDVTKTDASDPSKTDAAKTDAAKTDAAKTAATDAAKTAATDAAKTDASKTASSDTAKTDASKTASSDTAKTDAAKTDTSKTTASADAAKTDAAKTTAATAAAKTAAANADVAKTADAKTTAKPDTAKPGTSVSIAPKVGTDVAAPKVLPAELKAININLLPNWERDVTTPGTISFVVKIPGKSETATFTFNYGIEDARAPADRDAYKKWLADQKIFTSKDDRQKGVAWYLEGVDSAGKPAFRMVVTYGGKKLICYGSLYKESSLGDLRDQTIIQAKQICETLTL